MFIVTAKLSKNKLIAIVLGAGLLLIALVLLVSNSGWRAASAQMPGSTPSPKGVSDNAGRIAYLSGYGWNVEEEALEFQEVLIPETFDEVLSGYNTLQMEQGFDLTRYKGKRVLRYTYKVTNYPDASEGVNANLLIYKNTVVGGDICSVKMDGFMHGLSMKTAASS